MTITASTIDEFSVFERVHPTMPSISYTYGQTIANGVSKASVSARNSFVSVLGGYSTAEFTNEIGLTAPLTVSTSGAAGMTVNITDLNASTTVVSNSITSIGNALASTSTSVTFTPVFNPGIITYIAEDTSPVLPLTTASAAVLMRDKFGAAFGVGQARNGAFGRATPLSLNSGLSAFETQTSGATTATLTFLNAYTVFASGGVFTNPNLQGTSKITCIVTGGTVISGAAGGRFSTTSTGYLQYWRATSGTDTVFTFDQGITAFGFYSTDLGDVEGALSLYLLPDDGGPEDVVLVKGTTAGNGALLFFGFVTHAKRYTRVRFVCATPVDFYGIDDVIASDNLMVQDPTPFKAFGAYMLNAGKGATTTYTATIITSTGTIITSIPITNSQPAGGSVYWGFTLNSAATIQSVTIGSSSSTDVPIFDEVTFGVPFYVN